MTTTESLYRDSLIKWLQARRDYPHDFTPEPSIPKNVTATEWMRLRNEVRAEVIRDFERKQYP